MARQVVLMGEARQGSWIPEPIACLLRLLGSAPRYHIKSLCDLGKFAYPCQVSITFLEDENNGLIQGLSYGCVDSLSGTVSSLEEGLTLLPIFQVNIGSPKGSCQDKQVSGRDRPWERRGPGKKENLRVGGREGTLLGLVFSRFVGLGEFGQVLGPLVRGGDMGPQHWPCSERGESQLA